MPGQKILMKVNPHEPLDGSGRVCIHFVVRDEDGPFVEPHVLCPVVKDGETVKGHVEAKPTRCRLACDPKRTVAPITKGGVTIITPRTDEPRAVTCPKCKATDEYDMAMRLVDTEQ